MKTFYSLPLSLAALPCIAGQPAGKSVQERPNVLFICIDDLRRDLGCYGGPALTPHLDSLAAEGSLFFHHYVQVPTSGASRASMLTGRLPRTQGDTGNGACEQRIAFRKERKGPESLFHHLRNNGYHTVAIGKISHSADGYVYGYNSQPGTQREMPESWDELISCPGRWGTGWNAFFGYSDGTNRQGRNNLVKPYECAPCDDEGLPDGIIARTAVEKLKALAAGRQPFCLAIGFYKPHLPFNAPEKYWKLYDEERIGLSPAPDVPQDCYPQLTLHNSHEFGAYRKGDEVLSLRQKASDAYARKLRHAYFACVSYTDAQVGKVLQALRESGLAENTVIVVWGDHGWHLGDQGVWGKHTLYETALNSTLIIKAPGGAKGISNRRIVSSVDLYPTLTGLCGLPVPKGLDGKSLESLLRQPDDPSWHDVAYSYFGRGISVRVPGYRLSRYRDKEGWRDLLFRYQENDGRYEKENLAGKQPDKVSELLPLWEKGNLMNARQPHDDRRKLP